MSDFLNDVLKGMQDGLLGWEEPVKTTSIGYMLGYNAACDDEDDEDDEKDD